MSKNILVALGGNAILKHGERGTAEDQLGHIKNTCSYLVKLVKENYKLVITHGNGPQVGDILLKNELAKKNLPPMPLDVCGAESQGMIGYLLQLSMLNALKSVNLNVDVATIITQTIVHKSDTAFENPSKPIGPFYTAMEASKLRESKGWFVINDSGRGYRRVVPSPEPISILEANILTELYNRNYIIIACGGGGIPIIENADGSFKGIEAVIDKDHTAALLAKILKVDVLLILTDVMNVSLNYGKPNQVDLFKVNKAEAEKYLSEGQFPSGSMGPKVEACIDFLESGGDMAIITSLENALDALKGKSGTIIQL